MQVCEWFLISVSRFKDLRSVWRLLPRCKFLLQAISPAEELMLNLSTQHLPLLFHWKALKYSDDIVTPSGAASNTMHHVSKPDPWTWYLGPSASTDPLCVEALGQQRISMNFQLVLRFQPMGCYGSLGRLQLSENYKRFHQVSGRQRVEFLYCRPW